MAAVIRGTPNFTAPPSQNTAPVDEFRCLYTHDIRKKQKKWHDGTVKFHTFNRRVMVYDDVRNYVGDLHYRADEQFGEGIELQLDRGVMVEVGEPLGQTQTDVTALVNRGSSRGDTAHMSSSSATGPSVKRVNAETQGRPKSLAEVLGASQGRHGRARLPLQSPFEQRRSLEETRPEQPPTKKQKTASVLLNRPVVQPTSPIPHPIGKENFPVQSRPSPKKQSTSAHTATQRAESSATQVTKKSSTQPVQAFTARTVVDISSEEDNDIELGRDKNRRTDGNKEGKQRITSSASNLTNTVPSTKSRQGLVDTRPPNDRTKVSRPERQVRPSTAPSEPARTSELSRRQGSATLRFVASSKPRPKLMYKALLPLSTSQKSLSTPSNSSRQTGDRHGRNEPNEGTAISEEKIRDDGDNFETGLEGMDLDPPHTTVMQIDSPRDESRGKVSNNESLSQGSPLFVSQAEPYRLASSSPSHLPEDDSFGVSFTQELCNIVDGNLSKAHVQKSPSSKASTLRTPSPAPSESPVNTPLLISNRESPRQESTKALVTTTPRAIFSPTRLPNIPIPTSARQFRRVVSENDSPSLANLNPISPQSPPANSLPMIETPLKRRPPPLLSANNNIQRSVSDTQAIIPQPLEIETADTSLKQSDEQGPWTKLEAFLLFETWPGCKKKDQPVFERRRKDRDEDDGDEDEIDDGKKNLVNNFRSARMVLRDEQ